MQTKTEAGKAHEIKNPAIAIGIYGNGAKRIGDIAVTAKGLVWKNGRSKDVTVKWDAFVNWMQSQREAGAKTMKTATSKSAKTAKTIKTAKIGKTAQKAKSATASIKRANSGKTKPGTASQGTKINGRSVTAKKGPAQPAPKAVKATH